MTLRTNLYANIYDAWIDRLDSILRNGLKTSPRGFETLEELGVSFTIQASLNVIDHPGRNLNMRFAVAEWFWIMAGSDRLDLLQRYNDRMKTFSDDGRILSGAYGPRLAPQFPWVIEQLRASSDTRQAVAVIFSATPARSKDIPCTISLQFLIRAEMLHLIVTMRSSDTWFGLPYDVFTFSQIQNYVVAAVNYDRPFNERVLRGRLTMQLGSSHLYEPEWEQARAVVASPSAGRALRSPQLIIGRPSRAWLIAALEQRVDRSYNRYVEADTDWDRYARVLLAKNREDAMKQIRTLSIESTVGGRAAGEEI